MAKRIDATTSLREKSSARTALYQSLRTAQSYKNHLTTAFNFYIIRNMETKSTIAALAALAQETRLAIFRLLVEAGPQGLAVGTIAERLDVANATLSFHLKELTNAALTVATPNGRSIIYSANFATMNGLIGYLTENCCAGSSCSPLMAACEVGKPAVSVQKQSLSISKRSKT